MFSGTAASITPVSPPAMKIAKNPRIQSIGILTLRRPDHIVAIQQKTCVPVGIAMMMLAAVKKLSPELRETGREHVVDPQPEPHERGGDERQDDRQIPEHPPLREGGDDGRDNAGSRNEDDVDLGMAEEPEHVLPQQRVARVLDVEEMRADESIENERRAREHHGRHREQHHERRHDLRPHEDRDPVQRHPGRAQLEASS